MSETTLETDPRQPMSRGLLMHLFRTIGGYYDSDPAGLSAVRAMVAEEGYPTDIENYGYLYDRATGTMPLYYDITEEIEV